MFRNTKENCKSLKLDISNAVSAGVTAIKPHLSICQVGLVWFPRCCGKTDSRHLFSYGGLDTHLIGTSIMCALMVSFSMFSMVLKTHEKHAKVFHSKKFSKDIFHSQVCYRSKITCSCIKRHKKLYLFCKCVILFKTSFSPRLHFKGSILLIHVVKLSVDRKCQKSIVVEKHYLVSYGIQQDMFQMYNDLPSFLRLHVS